MKSISIIIPSHHSRGSVLEAVRSCSRQTFPDFEIVVALNEPHDPSRDALEKMENVKIAVAKAIGVNHARNAGARIAQGELLFFMDDDCRMTSPDFLQRLAQAFKAHPDFTIFGGPYTNPPHAPLVLRSYHAMTRLWIEADQNLLGGNLAVTRETFGLGFNESIITGGDETEFLRRARRAGARIGFIRELELEHHGSHSWKHACTRAWNQNHARGFHGLSSERGSLRRILAQREALITAWPYLLLHLGIGNLAAATGRVRRTLDPRPKGI